MYVLNMKPGKEEKKLRVWTCPKSCKKGREEIRNMSKEWMLQPNEERKPRLAVRFTNANEAKSVDCFCAAAVQPGCMPGDLGRHQVCAG